MKTDIIRYGFLLGLLTTVSTTTLAQESTDSSAVPAEKKKQWEFSGYLKDLQMIQFKDVNEDWTLDNLLHNRVDIRWYPSDHLKWQLGIRNRFFYGQSVPVYLQVPDLLSNTNDLLKMDGVLVHGKSFLLHSGIDRFYADYTYQNWEITLGRQRINWGQNLVWNPNDIFNAYSYFDFDYEERPGSDAIRIQRYLGSTSSAELALKPGRDLDHSAGAALYRFTRNSYDWQLMAGWMNGDFVTGAGWSGVLGKAGFNGEITGFLPARSSSQAALSASWGINYTFPNSLFLHGAYLFNSSGALRPDSLEAASLLGNVSAKTLSPAKHSLFVEAAYQLSPLIRADLASIINPGDGSFFTGPFFNFSLSNSSELLVGGQLFFGPAGSLYGGYGKLVFLRFKWSF